MFRLWCGAAAWILGLLWPLSVCGQPALDKLEQELQQPEPGYLGVTLDDRGEQGLGVRVLAVVQGGPAASAGLLPGDLLTHVDDRPVASLAEFAEMLSPLPAGTRVRFTVQREERTLELEATLAARPAAGRAGQAAGQPPLRLGARVKAVDLAAQRRLALPGTRGALVLAVHPGGLADRAGLKPDAVIVGINGQRLERPEDIERLLQRVQVPGKLALLCYLGGRLQERTVDVQQEDLERQMQPGAQAADAPRQPGGKPNAERRIAELERRVQELEARIAELEQMLQQPPPEPLP
jgi:S1-C subfamily serine protease